MNTKKFFTTFIISTALLLVVVFSFGVFYISNFNIGGGEDLEELDRAKPNSRQNILVLGTDESGLRCDTIMLFSISEKEENINILSIPRDLKVKIGSGYQKINASLAIGKENLTVQCVKEVTGVPIHDYVTINFRAAEEIIDALGGVDFNVPQNMYYNDPYQDLAINLKKGQQHLNGKKAVQMLRFREYPMADIERSKVQRNFIQAVFDQKLNVGNIDKIPAIYKSVSKNIKSSMSLSNIVSLATDILGMKETKINNFDCPYYLSGDYVQIDYKEASTIFSNNFR